MPGPGAVLFNHETNAYEEVPAERVSAALASGQYTSSGASTQTKTGEGETLTRPVAQMGAAAVQGESDAGAANAAHASAARLESRKLLTSDKALTFVEGVGDAMTLGLIHGTTEEDELRREVDSGSALMGQLVGTALGLKFPGPIKGVTAGGEMFGSGVARALLGEAETGFRGVVTRGLQEAGANAALMAASAFGHQVTDSVIADKPFAAESIASEAGYGALLGFGLGFAGSAFGKLAKASRGAVEASGVAVRESGAAMASVGDLTRTWDDVVDQHAQRVGVLKVLADDGHIPGDLHAERAEALREAESARDALKAIDPVRALGGDPKEFQGWRDAVERYQSAVGDLDRKMTPSMLERAHGSYGSPIEPGAGLNDAGPQIHPLDVDTAMADKGQRSKLSYEADVGMAGSEPDWTELHGTGEEFKAKYHEIYGRPWEDTPGFHGPNDLAGSENLGGTHTPTSELGTNPGTARGNTSVDPPGLELKRQRDYDAQEASRFNKAPAKYVEPRDTLIDCAEVGPRQVLQAGDAPASQSETASDFVNNAKNELLRLPPGEGESATASPHKTNTEGKRAVKDYLNNWFGEYDSKPRVSLGDQLQTRLTKALDDIAKSGNGRLDSAGSLALLKSLGLREAETPLGQRLDQVWSLGQAGKFAADEARGVATPMRRGLLNKIQRYATYKGARVAASAMLGGSVGGPLGAIVGMALSSAGFAGRAASSAGNLMRKVAEAGEALLKGRRATLVARAVMGNRPYQYSDAGPIADPVQRIMDVQRMAANPEAIKARVTHQLGDLALTSPDMAQHLLDTTVRNVQAIAASAPAIMLSPLGKPILPSGTAVTKFLDFEKAMHDLPGLLDAVAKGSASDAQIKALHIGYPAVHAELMRQTLGQNTRLDALEEGKLRAVERILGVSLTRSTQDPTVTARFQGNWEAPKPAPRPAQAFKITAQKPTPVQASSSGRAPGNERKP